MPQPCHIWVTRTQPGADRLAAQMVGAGFAPWVAPVLAVQPLPVAAPKTPVDLVVVLSEQAVAAAGDAILQAASLEQAVFIAVGPQTAAALSARGLQAEIPALHTSEGLLAGPLQPGRVSGRAILLLRGRSGRELLRDRLQQHAARVTVLDVYARVAAVTPVLDVPRIGAIVVSSGDGLQAAWALWQAAGGGPDIPILVPSARVRQIAAGIGARNAYNCGGADAEAVISTLAREVPHAVRVDTAPDRDSDVT